MPLKDAESVRLRNAQGFIDSGNPIQIQIGDGTNQADVIPINGYKGLVTMTPGHISTDNSTNVLLAGDGMFTGEWEDITNVGVILLLIHADQVSATDGLVIEFSATGTDVDSLDEYTYEAMNTGKTYSFQAAAKYFRVRYTNGSTIQTHFHLQTILKPYYVKPSSHRIADSISGQDDAELVKAVITGKNPSGTFVNITTTTAGNLKSSIEEYDDAANPVRKDMEGLGKVAIGTTATEVAFTGTPTHSVIIRADRNNTGLLFIGESNITNLGANSITYLEAGDSVTIDYDDADNAVYVVASVASQNFYAGALL